jgi:hypothetical protein
MIYGSVLVPVPPPKALCAHVDVVAKMARDSVTAILAKKLLI